MSYSEIFVLISSIVAISSLLSVEVLTPYLFRAILGLFVLYLSSIFLIPSYGLKGAAFSLLIAEFFVVFVSDIFLIKKTKGILIIKIKSLYSFLDFKSYKTILKKGTTLWFS